MYINFYETLIILCIINEIFIMLNITSTIISWENYICLIKLWNSETRNKDYFVIFIFNSTISMNYVKNNYERNVKII